MQIRSPRLFLASKATLTFLPNIHTDEETFYFIANIVLRDQDVLVAETNGEISGFIAMHEDMVEHLYVRPDLLRRGIGRALLQRAKERLPSGFRLWVFQQNVPARRFYERHGLPARRGDRWQSERGTDAGCPLRVESNRPLVVVPGQLRHDRVSPVTLRERTSSLEADTCGEQVRCGHESPRG